MSRRVVVIGAGVAGLSAAIRLARHGHQVRVLEARASSGGLASSFDVDGLRFDAGPYVLLDRPGLEWALEQLGIDPGALALRAIDPVYEVTADGAPAVRLHASLDETVDGLEHDFPGNGIRYRRFVEQAWRAHQQLRSTLLVSRPSAATLLAGGGFRSLAWVVRPLGAYLRRTGLPSAIIEALGIWTHVASQSLDEAPGPMAFVPALIHHAGAFYPQAGMGAVPALLERAAIAAGVKLEFDVRVRRVLQSGGRASAVETERGDCIAADAIVSNHHGVGTYLDLVGGLPARATSRLAALALQSPGVCAYLAVRGPSRPPYLRFHRVSGEPCRLLIAPALVDASQLRDGWQPMRLLAPMPFERAEREGAAGQQAWLDRILAEPWWREGLHEVRTLATRIPSGWGREFHLYRDSMNPVMTARFMRQGRLAHRSPFLSGLYLAGSSTHPGQWVSFCAISGVLAADALVEDLA